MWLCDYNGSLFWQVICHFSIECFGAGKGAISQWMVARHIGEKKKIKIRPLEQSIQMDASDS